jgi:hypothetical protein
LRRSGEGDARGEQHAEQRQRTESEGTHDDFL